MSDQHLTRAADPRCPVCQGELRFVQSGVRGGPQLYAEIHVYECPKHGAVYLTREGLRGQAPDNVRGDSGYADGPGITAPRKPAPPTLNDAAIAMPEPQSNAPTTHAVAKR